MRIATTLGSIFVLLCAGIFIWGILDPPEAEEVGFSIEDPAYLLGCYYLGDAEIRLERTAANFNGASVPISFGSRKELREVIYPKRFPWFDTSSGLFMFRNDRFDLVDLIEGENEIWEMQIWTSEYLQSKDPSDLDTVYFRKEDCRDNRAASQRA